jgi:hypothetical protein
MSDHAPVLIAITLGQGVMDLLLCCMECTSIVRRMQANKPDKQTTTMHTQ